MKNEKQKKKVHTLLIIINQSFGKRAINLSICVCINMIQKSRKQRKKIIKKHPKKKKNHSFITLDYDF
jgi:hypothetical protein